MPPHAAPRSATARSARSPSARPISTAPPTPRSTRARSRRGQAGPKGALLGTPPRAGREPSPIPYRAGQWLGAGGQLSAAPSRTGSPAASPERRPALTPMPARRRVALECRPPCSLRTRSTSFAREFPRVSRDRMFLTSGLDDLLVADTAALSREVRAHAISTRHARRAFAPSSAAAAGRRTLDDVARPLALAATGNRRRWLTATRRRPSGRRRPLPASTGALATAVTRRGLRLPLGALRGQGSFHTQVFTPFRPTMDDRHDGYDARGTIDAGLEGAKMSTARLDDRALRARRRSGVAINEPTAPRSRLRSSRSYELARRQAVNDLPDAVICARGHACGLGVASATRLAARGGGR